MGKQYELYVQKGQPFWKVLTNILFSHVGLLVLVIGYCVAGEKPGTYISHHPPHIMIPLSKVLWLSNILSSKERRTIMLLKLLPLR